VQNDGPLPGQGGAGRQEPVVQADGRWILGDLRFPGEQDFPDQFQFRVPGFKFPRVVDAGKLQETSDGGCAGDVLSRPNGEFRVAVEGDLSAREVADQSVEEGHHVILAEEPHQAIGNDHRRSVRGDGVQPIGFRNVGADVVSVAVCGYQALSSGDHGRVVDVVPVDGGWRRDPDHASVQPRAQVEPHRVWMVTNESRRHLIELFGSECDVENDSCLP